MAMKLPHQNSTWGQSGIERLANFERFPRKREPFNQILSDLELERFCIFVLRPDRNTTAVQFILDTDTWPKNASPSEDEDCLDDDCDLLWMAEALADPDFGDDTLAGFNKGQFGATMVATVAPLNLTYRQVLIGVRSAAAMADPQRIDHENTTRLLALLAATTTDHLLAEVSSQLAKSVTQKERQLIELLAEGLSVAKIAQMRDTSAAATRKQIARLEEKFDVTSPAQLTAVATRHGLLPGIKMLKDDPR